MFGNPHPTHTRVRKMKIMYVVMFGFGLILLAACFSAYLNMKVKKVPLVRKKEASRFSVLVFLAIVVAVILFAAPLYLYMEQTFFVQRLR